MDPLTSLGLFGNLLQIITFASSIGIETSKFVKSSNQSLPENAWLQAQAKRSEVLSAALCAPAPDGQNASTEETTLLILAKSCQDEASKLLALLSTLELTVRPGGSKSKLLAVKQVVRSKMAAGDIAASRKRLESLERQLTYAVVSGITKSQLEEFGKIKSILNENGAGWKMTNNILERVENEVHRIKRDLEDAREHKLAQRVIEALDFRERTYREEAIEEHHWTTYHWVLSERKFKSWLDGGDKLFWICGHPGSGKSTLMKYLAHSLLSAPSLKDSTSGTEILIASHYFWIAGHPSQKSILEMLQNFLVQLLSSLPSLTKIAFPNSWESMISGKVKYTGPSTKEGLLHAIHQISLFADVQIIFLVDGLDECNERNHPDLVNIIRRLASMERIRICLSSRPWPLFEREFGRPTPKLLLQSLTRTDMYKYTCTRLQSADPTLGLDATMCENSGQQFDLICQAEAKELVGELVDKADGVFFWLSLVLDTLCVRLLDGHSLGQLQRFIREFPPKLEDYFEKLVYERIAETYRSASFSETAMVLQIALMGESAYKEQLMCHSVIHKNLDFLHFWILRESILDAGEITVDPHFGTHAKFRSFTEQQLKIMLRDTNKYVVSCCKDFLHFPRRRDKEGKKCLQPTVVFRHRIAHDFLYTPKMQDLINNHVPPHFLHENMWWKQMTLCRLKIQHSGLLDIYDCLFGHASPNGSSISGGQGYQNPAGFEDYFLEWMDILHSHTEDHAPHHLDIQASVVPNQILTDLMQNGCHKFAARLIGLAQYLPLCCNTSHDPLLAVACGVNESYRPLEAVVVSTVSLVLNRDADPNVVSPGPAEQLQDRPNETIWQRLLFKMWLETHKRPCLDPDSDQIETDGAECDGTAIRYDLTKLMIEHGADVNARICVRAIHCHYHGHGPGCFADRCSEQHEHKFMCLEDMIDTILTPADAIEIRGLIARYCSPAVQMELKTARRSRIAQTITGMLSTQELKLLAGLIAANRHDCEFRIVYNEMIASGVVEQHREIETLGQSEISSRIEIEPSNSSQTSNIVETVL